MQELVLPSFTINSFHYINSVFLIIVRKSFVLAVPEEENKNCGKCVGLLVIWLGWFELFSCLLS